MKTENKKEKVRSQKAKSTALLLASGFWLLASTLHAQSVSSNFANLNYVRSATGFAGADAGAKIAACIADLPSTGGTCDARGLEGALAIGSDLVISKPVRLLLGATALTGAGRIYVTASNVEISGASRGTSITYTGSDTAHYVVNLGYNSDGSALTTSISGVEVSGLTLNAGNLARGALRAVSLQQATIHENNFLNGDGYPLVHILGGSGAAVSSDITVENNWVAGQSPDESAGDGIYFGGVLRPRAVNNTVSDFTRLGIVTEANGSVKSQDATIEGNYIFNAHDATSPESNGAIWCENTNGATIVGNRARNLTNTPGSQASRGITVSGGSDIPSVFLVADNVVEGAQWAFSLSPAADSVAVVDGLRVAGSETTIGVSITRGKFIEVSNGHFDDRDMASATAGMIVVGPIAAMGTVQLSNLVTGTITNTGSGAEINVYGGTFTIDHVIARGLHGVQPWRFAKGGTSTLTQLTVTDSVFNLTPVAGAFPAIRYFSIRDANNVLQVVSRGGTGTDGFVFDTGSALKITLGSSGIPFLRYISGTASLDFTALAANACEVLTVAVTGAADGDTVSLGIPTALADVDGATERTTFLGWVSAADVVSVRRCNVTGTTTAEPAAATVRADVWKH